MTTTTPKKGWTLNWAQREAGWMGKFHQMIADLDCIVGLRLKSRTTIAAPGSPSNGDAYWVPPGATGFPSTSIIAVYMTDRPVSPTTAPPVTPTAGWYSITPSAGLFVLVEDEADAPYYFNGTTFMAFNVPAVFSFKTPARVVATSNITLSAPQTIDGVSVIAGDRVLVTGQSTASQNGIYVCAAGAWSRSTDADASAEVKSGMIVPVSEGTSGADTLWLLTTNDPITLGSTSLAFSKIASTTPATSADTPNTLVLRDAGGGFAAGSVSLSDYLEIVNPTGAGFGLSVELYPSLDGIEITQGSAAGDVGNGLSITVAPTSGTHTGNGLLIGKSSATVTGAAIRINNNSTQKAGLTYSGELGLGTAPASGYDLKLALGKFLSAVADGASAVSHYFNTAALTTAGAKIVSFLNNGTEKAYIDKDGGLSAATGAFSGVLTTNSGRKVAGRVVTAAGAVTVTTADDVVVVNKSSGAATTVNLPTTAANLLFVIKDGKGDAATNNITITPTSGNIDGAATKVINVNYASVTLWCDGTDWWVI